MAGECTLVYETDVAIPFTCDDGTGIEKGAILKLTDPMTAATTTGDGDIVAGIAAEEKIANDGKTKIAVYRGGIFKGKAGGAITAGDPLATDTASGVANDLVVAAVNEETVVGIALETADDGHTFLFELRPTTMQLA